MSKPLLEYSLEELWQLFPIELKSHDSKYIQYYDIEAQNISSILKDKLIRISHIGSSAVKGLLAKPIIDILLEVKNEVSEDEIIQLLESNGWTLMSKQIEPFQLSFNKGYTENGFADKVFHLHLRHKGDWGELYFRDYLIDHLETANGYAKLKSTLLEKYRNNRDGYTEAKTQFIKKFTEIARKEYGNKYDN